MLQALFSLPDPQPMAFKGGTSLSKVDGIIGRFSEDVDITLDYQAFNDGFDPFADGASRNRIRRCSDRLKARVASYILDIVGPALDGAAERLAANGRYRIHIGDDGETIRFAYPSAVEEAGGYVGSEVLLECGGRNVIDPNEQHAIVPDIAALTPDLDYPAATVTILSPDRTVVGEGHAHPCRMPPPAAGEPARTALAPLIRPDVPLGSRCWPGRTLRPRPPAGCRPAHERCSCTPATPTTINASTANGASFPTTSSPAPCNPTTTPCATPASWVTTHRNSTHR